MQDNRRLAHSFCSILFIPLPLIICIIAAAPAHATTLGVSGGISYYRADNDNLYGFTASGHIDFSVANFIISPNFSFWTGKNGEDRLYDLTESLALKYHISMRTAKISPYVGLEPTMHILVGELPVAHFGINGLLGVDITLSDRVRMPIQASYGIIFAYQTIVYVFSIRLGLATAT